MACCGGMLSMTGYGTGSAPLAAASLVVEARALNHRFLDVRVHLPALLADHAGVVDRVARTQLVRGRIELSARVEGALSGAPVLDRERARAALASLDGLRAELGLQEPVPLSLLAVVPGLFREPALTDREMLRDALQHATDDACRSLATMRRAEGEALAADLRAHLLRISALCDQVDTRIEGLRDAHRDRLRARIATLLEGTAATLDPARVEQEVALLADRGDVSEEVIRLRSHCAQFGALLEQEQEPIGRRLEFLLQEMGREVNTLGSKVGDLDVTAHVLDLKTELERMREQAQNVL